MSEISHFYPRPPRGGRLDGHQLVLVQNVFLPTPSARRATLLGPAVPSMMAFLPTPSARRATPRSVGAADQDQPISTHALREEGDREPAVQGTLGKNFYPRPPRGGRRPARPRWTAGPDFYPRPPRGGRLLVLDGVLPCGHFYPRPPRGGRQLKEIHFAWDYIFLPTPSARRATCKAT